MINQSAMPKLACCNYIVSASQRTALRRLNVLDVMQAVVFVLNSLPTRLVCARCVAYLTCRLLARRGWQC